MKRLASLNLIFLSFTSFAIAKLSDLEERVVKDTFAYHKAKNHKHIDILRDLIAFHNATKEATKQDRAVTVVMAMLGNGPDDGLGKLAESKKANKANIKNERLSFREQAALTFDFFATYNRDHRWENIADNGLPIFNDTITKMGGNAALNENQKYQLGWLIFWYLKADYDFMMEFTTKKQPDTFKAYLEKENSLNGLTDDLKNLVKDRLQHINIDQTLEKYKPVYDPVWRDFKVFHVLNEPRYSKPFHYDTDYSGKNIGDIEFPVVLKKDLKFKKDGGEEEIIERYTPLLKKFGEKDQVNLRKDDYVLFDVTLKNAIGINNHGTGECMLSTMIEMYSLDNNKGYINWDDKKLRYKIQNGDKEIADVNKRTRLFSYDMLIDNIDKPIVRAFIAQNIRDNINDAGDDDIEDLNEKAKRLKKGAEKLKKDAADIKIAAAVDGETKDEKKKREEKNKENEKLKKEKLEEANEKDKDAEKLKGFKTTFKFKFSPKNDCTILSDDILLNEMETFYDESFQRQYLQQYILRDTERFMQQGPLAQVFSIINDWDLFETTKPVLIESLQGEMDDRNQVVAISPDTFHAGPSKKIAKLFDSDASKKSIYFPVNEMITEDVGIHFTFLTWKDIELRKRDNTDPIEWDKLLFDDHIRFLQFWNDYQKGPDHAVVSDFSHALVKTSYVSALVDFMYSSILEKIKLRKDLSQFKLDSKEEILKKLKKVAQDSFENIKKMTKDKIEDSGNLYSNPLFGREKPLRSKDQRKKIGKEVVRDLGDFIKEQEAEMDEIAESIYNKYKEIIQECKLLDKDEDLYKQLNYIIYESGLLEVYRKYCNEIAKSDFDNDLDVAAIKQFRREQKELPEWDKKDAFNEKENAIKGRNKKIADIVLKNNEAILKAVLNKAAN